MITYGLENCNLNLDQLEIVNTTEGNIVKKLLYLSTALNLRKQKLCFYQRLRANEYTDEVLNDLNKQNVKDTFVEVVRALVKPRSKVSLDAIDPLVDTEVWKMNQTKREHVKTECIRELHEAYNIIDARMRELLYISAG